MFALRIEVPAGVGVVGLKPEGAPTRLKFDEAGLVVSVLFVVGGTSYTALDMLLDSETLADRNLRPVALCHHNIRLQDA